MKTWCWAKSNRPKYFKKALRLLLNMPLYNLTERTLAIAAGSTRYDVYSWLDGNSLPSENELRDVAGAFCLNLFSRVICKERNELFRELLIIVEAEKQMNRSRDEER